MRVTIERSAFLKALTHVQSVVERRNTIPILSNVLLDAKGGKLSLTATDLDLVEINEAFAAQVIPSAKHLGIDIDRQLNVHGGAIALGHPFGMTGARIMTTLINGLQFEDKRFGLESMCVGGGQGMAMVIERLS